MKKKYVFHVMEITEFDIEDVITTSGDEETASPDYDINGDGVVDENDF